MHEYIHVQVHGESKHLLAVADRLSADGSSRKQIERGMTHAAPLAPLAEVFGRCQLRSTRHDNHTRLTSLQRKVHTADAG